MLTLIMNIMLWLSMFNGNNAFTGNMAPGAVHGAKIISQPVKGFVPGDIVPAKGIIQLKSTIVLEDDTHFKPFFGLRK